MTTTSDHLSILSELLGNQVALPGEPAYDAAMPWNVAAAHDPCAVVTVTSAADVAATICWASEHGVKVAVQATGHGSTGVGPDTVLISTSGLRQIDIDADAATATIGAGATWREVIDRVAPHGLAPICGSAPGVGVVGLLVGGGVGPLVRSFGLSADYVRSMDLVTGDGEIRQVTPQEHPDLYRSMRGAKSALGVITSVELDLVRLPELTGGAIYFDGADAAAVLHRWREWTSTLPDDVDTSVAVLRLPPMPEVPPVLAGRVTVAVRFAGTDRPEAYERLLEPIRSAAEPLLDSVGGMPYTEIGAIHADPVDPLPAHEGAAMLAELPADAVDALVRLAGADADCPQLLVELRLLGGALRTPRAHPSAYCHREAAFALLTIGVPTPETAEAIASHSRTVIGALAPYGTGGRMPNFGATVPLGPGEHRYNPETLADLEAQLDRYDPRGVLVGRDAFVA